MPNRHPNINNFEGKINKGTVTRADVESFEKWMHNPDKFPEDCRPEAEALLKKAQEKLAAGLTPPQRTQVGNQRAQRNRGNGQATIQNNNTSAEEPKVYGGPFHNPYTFVPFPTKGAKRHKPTPLTMDEKEKERFTGILEVSLKTLSPLLTPDQQKKRGDRQNENNAMPENNALRIGNDVIVPATAIRGCLRTLTALISESALDYVDDELFLCQQRDAQLGGVEAPHLYLAIVEKPGTSTHAGIVKFGPAKLVKTNSLPSGITNKRDPYVIPKDPRQSPRELWIDNPDARNPQCAYRQDNNTHPWRVKLSGRKVSGRGTQHEGALDCRSLKELVLPAELWRDFNGRHRNAQKTELKKGDMVWLEANEAGGIIQAPGDVKSIQWARWGRHGVQFLELLKQKFPHMLPDSFKDDGLVDITSDLFGAIPGEKKSFEAFAGRVRPDNLVFIDGKCFWNEMPALSSPHPGCKAFYADNQDYDAISLQDGPRGYKVYRTAVEHGDKAPWLYKNQPIFDKGAVKPFAQCAKMTCKSELLKEGSEGSFRLTVRSLSKKELSLLLLVLSCDLRIGGGKSLGLGHCLATKIVLRDESGTVTVEYTPSRHEVPQKFSDQLEPSWTSRAKFYCKTQEPVTNMRYPRAGKANRNGLQFGGMCWFGEFAPPKQGNNPNGLSIGLATKNVANGSTLTQERQIRAQGLPYFDPKSFEDDWLYGYDVQLDYDQQKYVRRVLECKPQQTQQNNNRDYPPRNNRNNGGQWRR